MANIVESHLYLSLSLPARLLEHQCLPVNPLQFVF